MRVPFTIFFAILIDFLPPKPPNRGAKLESIKRINRFMFQFICIFAIFLTNGIIRLR